FQDWKTKTESELFPGYTEGIKKESHCSRCSHVGSMSKHKKEGCIMCDSTITCYMSDSKKPCACKWCQNNLTRLKQKNELKVYLASKDIPDFPSIKVIEEYLNFTDQIPDDDTLDWQCPNLKEFQGKAFHYLSWTFSNSFEKCLPIITSWQQFKLSKLCQTDSKILLYKPVKVVKSRIVGGVDCLEIQWTLTDDESSEMDDENLRTVENEERFKKSYLDIVEKFYSLLQKSKSPSKPKNRKVPKESNKKMTDFFSIGSNSCCESQEGKKVNNSENGEERTTNQCIDDYEPDYKKQWFCEGDTRNRWCDGQVCPDVDKKLWRLGPDGSGGKKNKKDRRVRERERTEGGGKTEKRERRRKETERESGRERVMPALNGEKG
ncbi:flap endonuclease GEN, partial [Trichonephila clavipes]